MTLPEEKCDGIAYHKVDWLVSYAQFWFHEL